MVKEFKVISYEMRLRECGLTILETRRWRLTVFGRGLASLRVSANETTTAIPASTTNHYLDSDFIIIFSFMNGIWGDNGNGHDDLLLNGKKLL